MPTESRPKASGTSASDTSHPAWTVLSIRQPEASLVLCSWKVIENRSWSTDYRGRLHIHASGPECRLDRLRHDLGTWEHDRIEEVRLRHGLESWPGLNATGDRLRSGVILGHVELLDVIPYEESTFDTLEDRVMDLFTAAGLCKPHDPLSGINVDANWFWVLGNPVVLDEPIPAKGSLRLWTHPGTAGE